MSNRERQGKDYAIGYCRPPVHSRFQKGVCPNPKGRGKAKLADVGASLEHLLEERVRINIDGRKKLVSRREAHIWGLAREAMAGNLAAAEQVVDLLTKKGKKYGNYSYGPRTKEDVMQDIADGLLPKNTILLTDLLEQYGPKVSKA